MNSPKYSIVMPVLNGYETLSKTLALMLKSIDYDDFEFIISNNLSEDKTKDLVTGINDKRLRLIEPKKRLTMAEHLVFALSHAKGKWISYIGHDDYILPSIFNFFDSIIKQYDDIDIIRGEPVSYCWDNYYDENRANILDPCVFDNKIKIVNGHDIASYLLNTPNIHGGGAWCVNKEIIQSVIKRGKQHSNYSMSVEFFLMRAACVISKKIFFINTPVYIHGRHSSSSGSQVLNKKNDRQEESYDIAFENKSQFGYTPFKWLGYAPVSLDASLHVKDVFSEEFKHAKINWWKWIRVAEGDVLCLIHNKQLSKDGYILFKEGIKKMKWHYKVKMKIFLLIRILYRNIFRKNLTINDTLKKTDIFYDKKNLWGWHHYLNGNAVGIKTINDIPDFLKKNFPNFLKLH